MKRINPVYQIILIRTLQASGAGELVHLLFHWPLTGSHALGLFLTPSLCLYFVFVFVAPLTWGLPILSRLPGKQNAVALTFDDGPSLETTPLILDILRTEGVEATFFVLGEAVSRHPDLLQRIVSEGHAVGIHGFRHKPLVLQNVESILSEISQSETAIRNACPQAVITPWLRPPHGFKSLSLTWVLRRAGYSLAAWSLDSRDYRESDPERIAGCVAEKCRAGDVILLHDGAGNTATIAALRPILQGLVRRGFSFTHLGRTRVL